MASLRGLARALVRPADSSSLEARDASFIEQLVPWADRVGKLWWRLELEGVENLPAGSALIVGNHNSGITFIESIAAGARVHRKVPTERWYGMAHDAMVDMPVVGLVLTKLGALRAGHDTAAKAFASGGKVVVFPGGNLEAFRPWRDRRKVVFGGRKGFIKLALRHQVPIVPWVFHGGHSGFVVLHDGRRFAKLSGAKKLFRSDTWPLWVGLPFGVFFGPMFHVPLPVKVYVRFLEPIDVAAYGGPEAAEDPEVLQALYDRVTGAMQACLDELGKA